MRTSWSRAPPAPSPSRLRSTAASLANGSTTSDSRHAKFASCSNRLFQLP